MSLRFADHQQASRDAIKSDLRSLIGTKRSICECLWGSRWSGMSPEELVFSLWPQTRQPWKKAKTVRGHLRDLEKMGLVRTVHSCATERWSIACI